MSKKPQFDPDALIDAAAPMLGLTISDPWRPGVRLNLETAARMAEIIDAFPLADDAEPAPVFRP